MKVNAGKAFALMFELLKEKPWINAAGVMDRQDQKSEPEALMFLTSLGSMESWGDCSEPASRVVNSLLLDFMAKLNTPFYARKKWEVRAEDPPWRQAAKIVRDEIFEHHPHLPKIH